MIWLMILCFPSLCFGKAIFDDYLPDIKEHREKCQKNIALLHYSDPGYVWYDRTLLTLSCGDCDVIPEGAGCGKGI